MTRDRDTYVNYTRDDAQRDSSTLRQSRASFHFWPAPPSHLNTFVNHNHEYELNDPHVIQLRRFVPYATHAPSDNDDLLDHVRDHAKIIGGPITSDPLFSRIESTEYGNFFMKSTTFVHLIRSL